jgi:hypothetical protein
MVEISNAGALLVGYGGVRNTGRTQDNQAANDSFSVERGTVSGDVKTPSISNKK